eukprot:COSAG02_NODE_37075_length_446_cov_1.951009_1_plen_120_part_10
MNSPGYEPPARWLRDELGSIATAAVALERAMAAGTSAPEIDGLDELAPELESDGLLQQPEQVRGHEQTLAADSASDDQAADDGSGDEFEHILPRQPAPSAPLTTEERPAQPEPGAETTDE